MYIKRAYPKKMYKCHIVSVYVTFKYNTTQLFEVKYLFCLKKRYSLEAKCNTDIIVMVINTLYFEKMKTVYEGAEKTCDMDYV